MSIIQYHPRRFGALHHVYPVISRRSGGLSLGVNLSPTALCNFACVYCQILAEKTKTPIGNLLVSMDQLEEELRFLIDSVNNDSLFSQSWLSQTPPEKRILKDIAFSGDGEPTLSPQFADAVKLVADVRRECCDDSVKTVLITNAATLHLTPVRSALETMLQNNGEIWAKLDAGTPDFFRTVNRSKVSFETVRNNLINFTQDFPAVIQTCFLAMHGEVPGADEVRSYAEILNELSNVLHVQIYTVARNTPENWATPLNNEQLDEIAEAVRRFTNLEVRTYYSH